MNKTWGEKELQTHDMTFPGLAGISGNFAADLTHRPCVVLCEYKGWWAFLEGKMTSLY